MSLVSLVYVSVSSSLMNDDELRQLLAKCRENNQKLDVTGMLLYKDGLFIQTLEGEAGVVANLYDKIAQDPRHYNILKVYQDQISVRSFPNWTMGFNKLPEVEPVGQSWEGYTDFLAQPHPEYFMEHPDRARALLESFKDSIYF
ncbi:MAG TPA: BLUF domain-containing protein [Phototrophicaceae bacterium]|jgi:hypothetical protein|nr:BLUF domain-containing protein [Phototrophicaceae bacterium]